MSLWSSVEQKQFWRLSRRLISDRDENIWTVMVWSSPAARWASSRRHCAQRMICRDFISEHSGKAGSFLSIVGADVGFIRKTGDDASVMAVTQVGITGRQKTDSAVVVIWETLQEFISYRCTGGDCFFQIQVWALCWTPTLLCRSVVYPVYNLYSFCPHNTESTLKLAVHMQRSGTAQCQHWANQLKFHPSLWFANNIFHVSKLHCSHLGLYLSWDRFKNEFPATNKLPNSNLTNAP